MQDLEDKDMRSVFWLKKQFHLTQASVLWLKKQFHETQAWGGTSLKTVWYCPLTKKVSLSEPARIPSGGFLAEEMGMGKTVEVLALILSRPAPVSLIVGSRNAAGKVMTGATLVVCPVSLVGQWVAEAKEKSGQSLKILQYHGSARPWCGKRAGGASLVVCPVSLVGQWVAEAKEKSGQSLKILQYHGSARPWSSDVLATYDVVVTTYSTVGAECGSRSGVRGRGAIGRQTLQDVQWYSFIYDESHTIKAKATKQSIACCSLAADRRWCCTGTPISNSFEDLVGQLGALHMTPIDSKPFYDRSLKNALGLAVAGAEDLVVVEGPGSVEGCICAAGVDFTKAEKKVYSKIQAWGNQQYASIRSTSSKYVMSNILKVMSFLGVPDEHRWLGSGHLDEVAAAMALAASSCLALPAPLTGAQPAVVHRDLCAICGDIFEDVVITPCQHWFCRECITSWLAAVPSCATCNAPMLADQLVCVKAEGQDNKRKREDATDTPPRDPAAAAAAAPPAHAPSRGLAAASPPGYAPGLNAHGFGSKLKVLLEELLAMRAADPSAKALIFSQFK
eukprot:gene5761-6058_t